MDPKLEMGLDDPEFLKERDPDGMLAILAGLPEQCKEALKLGQHVPLPFLKEAPRQIVMAGLGGSAIGGDLIRAVVARESRVPILVCRDYSLPAFVDKTTLVFLTSYSGNTEETLSSYEEAKRRGAIQVVVTTGGELVKRAQKDGVSLILVPGGLPPRSAIGYLFLPALLILRRFGLVPEREDTLELVDILWDLRHELEPQSVRKKNQAKDLASRLYGKIPMIYGVTHTTEVVAARWKGQFNENSKCLAYWNVFPEMNHNEIVGFEAPPEMLQCLELIFLREATDHPRVQARIEITKRFLSDRVRGISEFWGRGSSLLTRLFSLIYLGDYASVYLALLYGINPKPVTVIDYLKEELAHLS